MKSRGKALIFSAPSGSGKTTIIKFLLENNPDLEFSISASTRNKRGGSETEGKDYYFLSQEDFRNRIEKDEFIEWEEVYEGNLYGTLKTEVERLWDKGQIIVFDVDVKGGLNLKNYFGSDALSIFIMAPSDEVLKERLTARNTESEEALSKRLSKAKFEQSFADQFDVVLINDDLEITFRKAQELVDGFKNG